jgi:hypothetical protein
MAVNVLMKRANYDRLLEIRESYTVPRQSKERPAYPFVPVAGTGGALPYRILIIGQATSGWADMSQHGTFERSANKATEVLEDSLSGNKKGFWNFSCKFVMRTLDILGERCPPEDLYKLVAWSNLAKIGVEVGNPSDKFLDVQDKLCVDQLKYELDEYKPDLILILSEGFGIKKVLVPAFGDEWPHLKQTIHVQFRMVKNSAGVETPAIWTNHPRNLVGKGENHDDVLTPITRIAAEFLRASALNGYEPVRPEIR